MTESIEQLRAENIRLRQQAHYYKSMHARAVARLQRVLAMAAALKQKVAELMRRRFGRSSEKSSSSPTSSPAAQSGKEAKPRGQQPGSRGHGRRKRPDLPEEKLLVAGPGGAPLGQQGGLPYHGKGTVRCYTEIV